MKHSLNSDWEAYRRAMLRETERFIEWGLAHPDDVIEIPAKPVGTGGFPREVGQWFWTTVLSSRPTRGLLHWREVLRNRPRKLLQKVWNRR